MIRACDFVGQGPRGGRSGSSTVASDSTWAIDRGSGTGIDEILLLHSFQFGQRPGRDRDSATGTTSSTRPIPPSFDSTVL